MKNPFAMFVAMLIRVFTLFKATSGVDSDKREFLPFGALPQRIETRAK